MNASGERGYAKQPMGGKGDSVGPAAWVDQIDIRPYSRMSPPLLRSKIVNLHPAKSCHLEQSIWTLSAPYVQFPPLRV